MIWIYAGIVIWVLVGAYYLYRDNKYQRAVAKKIAYDKLTQDLSSHIEYLLSPSQNPSKKVRKVTVVPEFIFIDDEVSGMTDAQLAKKAIKRRSKKQIATTKKEQVAKNACL